MERYNCYKSVVVLYTALVGIEECTLCVQCELGLLCVYSQV